MLSQTTTSIAGAPDLIVPGSGGADYGLIIGVVAAVAVLVLVLSGRRRFRRPRFLDDSPRAAAREVEGIWGQALDLQQGLAGDHEVARAIEVALRRLRGQLRDDRLADEVRQLESAAAQLRTNLGYSARSAALIARRLGDS